MKALTSTKRLLFVTSLVLVLSCWLASQLQTAGGRVEVQSIKIPTHKGQWVVADVFKPRSATMLRAVAI